MRYNKKHLNKKYKAQLQELKKKLSYWDSNKVDKFGKVNVEACLKYNEIYTEIDHVLQVLDNIRKDKPFLGREIQEIERKEQ